MKKMVFLFACVFALGLTVQAVEPAPKDVNPVGTWTFSAPDAPYGYNAGDIVVAKEKDAYTVNIKFGDYTIKGYNVKYEKNVLSFTAYIESDSVIIKATFGEDNKVTGKANSSEGDIAFTATKKEKK